MRGNEAAAALQMSLSLNSIVFTERMLLHKTLDKILTNVVLSFRPNSVSNTS